MQPALPLRSSPFTLLPSVFELAAVAAVRDADRVRGGDGDSARQFQRSPPERAEAATRTARRPDTCLIATGHRRRRLAGHGRFDVAGIAVEEFLDPCDLLDHVLHVMGEQRL